MALYATQEYSRAILEFKNAATAVPEDGEPHFQLGLSYLALRDIPSAIQSFRRATELDPKHSAAQTKLGEILARSRDQDLLQEAASRLEGVLAKSPDSVNVIQALAVAEFQIGKRGDAIARLQGVLGRFPAQLESAVVLAKLKVDNNDLGGATEVFKSVKANAPDSPEVALALGQLYLLTGQPKLAEPEIRKALQLSPRLPDALLNLATILMNSNRLDEAERVFGQLATLADPTYKPLHAIFLYQSGHREQALAEFEKLLRENPDDRMTRSRLVAACLELDHIDKANLILSAALKKNPQDTDALYQRGLLYLREGKNSEAQSDLSQVIHQRPDFSEAYLALGAAYSATGQWRNARDQYSRALTVDPELLEARLLLARQLVREKQPASAIRVVEETPKAQKGDTRLTVERNWALLQLGHTSEVRDALKGASLLNHAPEFVLQDAIVKMQERDYAGVRSAAEELLRSNPEDVSAAGLLAESYAAQNNLQKALERLGQLANSRPGSARMQYLLGQWQARAGRLEEAQKAFQASKQADASFSEADVALATLDVQASRFDAARQRLIAILKAEPRNVTVRLTLASVESSAGNRAAAIAHYRAALESDDTNLFALNNVAYLLSSDQTDEALRYAERAANIAPNDPTIQDTLGWIYYRKAIYTLASEHFKAATAKQPTPQRQYHLALSYLKSGQEELGRKIMALALQQDPNLARSEN